MNKLVLAAALLAAPLAARADIGLRLGAEAGILHHDDKGTTVLTDNWPLAANGMLSYWLPGDLISVDAELSRSFTLSPLQGTATTTRFGVTVSPPILPIYVRAAVPLRLWGRGDAPFLAGLRAGAGMNFGLSFAKLYIEADADFPLFGGTGAPSAFGTQDISLGAGLAFRF